MLERVVEAPGAYLSSKTERHLVEGENTERRLLLRHDNRAQLFNGRDDYNYLALAKQALDKLD